MIRKLKIENYRSLESVELNLNRLNLLVGPNNSGKSNLLNALAFLGQLSRGSINDSFGAGPRAFEQILYRDAPIDSSIGVSVELEGLELESGCDSARYSVAVRRTSPEAPFEVTDESLVLWDSEDDSEEEVVVFETDDRRKARFDGQTFGSTRDTLLFQFRGSTRHPEIGQVARALSRQRAYRFDPWVAGTPCDDVETRDLGHDGRNLPAVLFTLRASAKERFDAIEERLAHLLPSFQRLTLPVIGNRSRALGMIEQAFDSPFTARELSDGVLLTIALVTLAHLETAPSIIGIEEPEQGLHPERLRHMMDLFQTMAEGVTEEEAEEGELPAPPRQIILTSHSPTMLEQFREFPESIFVARRDGGRSIIKPLTDYPDMEKRLAKAKISDWHADILGDGALVAGERAIAE
jgi:predicted ATPase